MNLLSDAEYLKVMEWLSTFSAGGLEEFYDDMLKPDILPRATREQRERLYKRFMMFYRVKTKAMGRKMRSDITDMSNWINVGRPTYVSELEEKAVKVYLNKADTIKELDDYYQWVVEHVFPRATPKQKKRIMTAYDLKLVRLEREREMAEASRKAMEMVKKTPRPERGQEVTMDGTKGVVTDRSVTTPEVEVRWEDGTSSWIHPKYLKW